MTAKRIHIIVCIILFFACIMFNQHYEQKLKAPVQTGAFYFYAFVICLRYALIKPSISPSITAWILPFS